MPAEWERHQTCWMAWPCRHDLWPDIEVARDCYAQVANIISELEPVKMLVRAEDRAVAGRKLNPAVNLLELQIDDSWARDTGPTFVEEVRAVESRLVGIDWRFNGWGEKFLPYAQDQQVAQAICQFAGIPAVTSSLTLEGGAIHSDGEGTLLVTEQCLLNPNRNPGWSREAIEREMRERLGCEQIIWLERGLIDDHTDGHIDEIACFVAPGEVLALASDDPQDANYSILARNTERLLASVDARGRRLKVHQVMQPQARFLADGRRMSLSYVNFYLANDAVIMASFGQEKYDQLAYNCLRECFPDRQVRQVPVLDLFAGGGGIHCITQQQPVART